MTRFHMSLILFCTIFSGVLFSKIYLQLGMKGMTSRYLLVLISAYLVFLLLIKIWLSYLTSRRSLAEDMLDAVDLPSDLGNLPSPGEIFRGQGGDFGGGGASGAWDSVSAAAQDISSSAVESVGSAVESASEGVADTAGEAVSGIADEGAIILIPLAILFLVIFGAGAYLIYEAPVILSEAAFEFLLASSLIKGAKKMDKPDWMGSVFSATWIPLAITAVVVIIVAQIVTSHCPLAVSIKDLLNICT